MSFRFEVRVPEDELKAWSAAMKKVGGEWLGTFGQQMIDRTLDTFGSLAHGGTHRGVRWLPFKRKPPARRGGWSARLLDDTGRLKSSVGKIFAIAQNRLVIGANVPYAGRQHRMRPFLFFEVPEDVSSAAAVATSFIKKALAGESETGSEKRNEI